MPVVILQHRDGAVRLGDRINYGGFGVVYRATHPDGTEVACKIFGPRTQYDEATIVKLKKRFKREVLAQSRLSERFVMPVLKHDLDASRPWYTMPLADSTYIEQIKKDRSSDKTTEEPLANILDSLEELHRLGYVHRDLRPDNILKNGERWKLCDFGLVLPPSGETRRLTSADSSWGSDFYAAPEQQTEFSSVGPAADIYSFGCILHDLFDGSRRVPYAQQSTAGRMGGIIEKCTDPDPSRRFKTVLKLRNALFGILSTHSVKKTVAGDEWATRLASHDSWDDSTFADFVRFSGQDTSAFWGIEEETVESFSHRDPGYWQHFAQRYCRWIASSRFDYPYCDVLVHHLEKVYEHANVAMKALAAVSIARLGYDHNRWYVMKRLLNLCDVFMDDTAAERVALEIQAEEAEDAFIACARRIGNDIDRYHSSISTILTAHVEKQNPDD